MALRAWIVTLLPFAYAAIGSFFILIPATISVTGIERVPCDVVTSAVAENSFCAWVF